MAKVFEFDEAQKKDFAEWLSGRPKLIQEMATSHPPNLLYRMESTGHRVLISGYSENNTCIVAVTAKYNFVTNERRVFGIQIDDLVECDLPGPDEPVGTVLSQEEFATALAEGNTAEERMAAIERAANRKLSQLNTSTN